MAEQKSVAALQSYLALAKGVSGKACADIIMKATEAPGCYVFGELLDIPNIKALDESPEHQKYLKLLRIFAYGTYSDYLSFQSTLPALSAAQITKLKQLSLITLATQARKTPLTYTHLLSSLDISSVRLLEDLVISCIYAGLLDAKLDTLRQRVEVRSTAGRDIAPGDVEAMLATMENWSQQCEGVLADIEAQIQAIYDSAAKVKKETDEYQKAVEKKKEGGSMFGGMKGKRVIPGEDDEGEEMDLDEEHGVRNQRRKRLGAQKKR